MLLLILLLFVTLMNVCDIWLVKRNRAKYHKMAAVCSSLFPTSSSPMPIPTFQYSFYMSDLLVTYVPKMCSLFRSLIFSPLFYAATGLGDNCTSNYDCVLYYNQTALCSDITHTCICAPGYEQQDNYCITAKTTEVTTIMAITTTTEATTTPKITTFEDTTTTTTTITTETTTTTTMATTTTSETTTSPKITTVEDTTTTTQSGKTTTGSRTSQPITDEMTTAKSRGTTPSLVTTADDTTGEKTSTRMLSAPPTTMTTITETTKTTTTAIPTSPSNDQSKTTASEQLTITYLGSDGPKYVNETTTLSLTLHQGESVSCILWNFNDQSKDLLLGSPMCVSNVSLVECRPIPEDRTVISVQHVFSAAGSYVVHVKIWNDLSDDARTMTVSVLDDKDSCTVPQVNLQSVGPIAAKAVRIKRDNPYVLIGTVNISCTAPRMLKCEWQISRFDGGAPGDAVFSSSNDSLKLYLPPRRLDRGLYEVSLRVYPEGMEQLSGEVQGFIRVDISPIIARLSGGTERSVSWGSTIVLDGTGSYDPDVGASRSEDLIYKWSCWALGDDPMDEWCIGRDPGSVGTIYVNTGGWEKLQTYIVQLEVSGNGKASNTTQSIQVVGENANNIAILCLSNCGESVSPNKTTKLEAVCSSCRGDDQVAYSWRAYKRNTENDPYEEIPDTGIYITSIGTDGKYALLNKGMFNGGRRYRIRVEGGGGYATYDFTVIQPPEGGSCEPNTYLGYAWETEFTFSCTGYKQADGSDDDDSIFKYDFLYKSVGSRDLAMPLCSYRGRDITTQPVMLNSGLKQFDHKMEIHIRITNDAGASGNAMFLIKVIPSEFSTSDILSGKLMTQFEMKQDFRSILNYALGADSVISHREQIYYSQENYEDQVEEYDALLSAREHLLKIITRNTDLLLDVDDCLLTAKTMKSFANRPETLSIQAKTDIGNIVYAAIRISLRETADGEPGYNRVIATDILDSVISIQNASRIQPRCLDPDPITADVSPEDKAILEKKAQALASSKCKYSRNEAKLLADNLDRTLKSLKTLLARDMVPGEEPFIFKTPDVSYRMEMKVSSELSDVKLDIGKGSFYLPKGFGHLLAKDAPLDSPLESHSGAERTVPVGAEAIFYAQNDYAFSDSAPANQPEVIGLSFTDKTGEEYNVNQLKSPLKIYQSLNDVKTELKNATVGVQNLIKFNVSSGPLFIELTSLNDDVMCVLRVNFHEERNEADSDWMDEIHLSESTPVKRVLNALNDTTVYMAYLWKALDNITEVVDFKLTLWQPKCVYYNEYTGAWEQDGCQVSEDSTPTKTICLANHLTLFSSDWIVPPNTIDFSTVFDDGTEKLVENMHVFMTITVVLVIYFVLVIILRRMDKKDMLKWGVAPLADNTPEDSYHYQMTVHTGMRKNAGTESTVYFMLGGERADTEVRKLEDTLKRPLSRGSVNNYLLSVPEPLGPLMYIRVWHDNSGRGSKASWFLDRIVIRDIHTNEVYAFLADRWLAVDKDDGDLECLFPAASEEDLVKFQYIFSSKTKQDLSDGHLWFSLVSRPTRSTFTRVQRLSCCLALLFSTMIANAMWYKSEENIKNTQVVHLGPLTFTPQQLFISLASSLVSVPISLIIVTLFRKSRPKVSEHKKTFHYVPEGPSGSTDRVSVSSRKMEKAMKDKASYLGEELDKMLGILGESHKSADPRIQTNELSASGEISGATKKKRRTFMLPWWCSYVAWLLVLLTVAFSGTFTMLYSFQWGKEKSSKWLTAFLLSFVQSVFFIQPLKVIGLAVFIALIVKKHKREVCPEEVGELDGDFVDAENKEMDLSHRIKRIAHRKPYAMKAVDESHLQKLREERKKEVKMWAIFREILSYIIYIMVISALTYDSKDPNSYRSKDEISKLFVCGKLEKVKTFSDFWMWSNKTLVPNLYNDHWYNGNEAHWRLRYFTTDMTYFRIGSPRLRLERVKKNSCEVMSKMSSVISSCYDSYGLHDMDDDDYAEGWLPNPNTTGTERKTPWQYQNTLELDGIPVWGNVGSYSGGGYVAELGTKPSQALSMLQYLRDSKWLDRSSRAVFVEFNLFNPNTNLFSIANLGLEFPPSGGVVTFPVVQTLRLYNYVGGRAIFRLFLDLTFVIFTIYFFVVEGKKMRQQKREYFKGFWNILELCNLVGSVLACAMYGVHYVFARHTISKFQKNREKFTNFQYVMNWDDMFGYVLAVLVFMSMIKLLKLLRFNKKVAELMSALDLASESLLGFFLFFVILYMAFGQFCYMIFGRVLQEYSTFISSLESLFSMMLMNFNYHHLVNTNRILGPIFFFVYVVLLAFVVINVLVSILNENFTLVKTRNLLTNDDYEMVEYIMNNFKKLFSIESWSSGIGFKKSVPTYTETEVDSSLSTASDDTIYQNVHQMTSGIFETKKPVTKY